MPENDHDATAHDGGVSDRPPPLLVEHRDGVDWVNLGYKEWGNGGVSFNFPIIMQAAFLRCQD